MKWKKYTLVALLGLAFILVVNSLNDDNMVPTKSQKTIKKDESPSVKDVPWAESAALIREHRVTDDGDMGEWIYYIGNNGKFGFQTDSIPLIVGKSHRYFWQFWGDKETLTKPFKVIAYSKETKEKLTVFELMGERDRLSPIYGADDHIPSTISLPSKGLWRLEVFFGEELFGNVIVNVEEETHEKWEERDEYVKDGEVLLEVYPDNLVAGKSIGYLFHFTAPFETFKGKELAIYAYHKETGDEITAVSPEIIEEPPSGYSSLQRFTANFKVPKSGLWRYEVVLDGEFYADVVFTVKE